MAAERGASRAEPVSVGFRAPALSAVAAGLKRLEMRLADDPVTSGVALGSVMSGTESSAEGVLRCAMEVTSKCWYPSPGLAWVALRRVGLETRLFPPGVFDHVCGRVDSAYAADALYATFFARGESAWESGGVHVFGVKVLTQHDTPAVRRYAEQSRDLDTVAENRTRDALRADTERHHHVVKSRNSELRAEAAAESTGGSPYGPQLVPEHGAPPSV